MKTEITVLGKTVEEAVLKAVEELGAPSAEAITYTVLEEPKKGFLGIGAVPAKITAVYQKKGADIALDFIKTLVREMELDATVTMEDGEDDNKLIRVDGESAGVLIGHHGDTLDSLQYLANLAANKKVAGEKREYCRVTVDVENYRAKREETLRALARRMADKVLRYKKSVMLEPMNPYERRIIHSEVQHIEGVSTNSIGSENNRKVVMYLDTETKAEAAKQSRDEYSEF
ncbi:MAG: protein jag [Clostridia bacterium]|nr:protein jag [Clostridia bacterium]